jgi:hypothetical protein
MTQVEGMPLPLLENNIAEIIPNNIPRFQVKIFQNKKGPPTSN